MRHFNNMSFFTLLLFIAVCILLPSAVSAEELTEETAPHGKSDGSPFRIAYVDYDEYLPASRQLYYILAGLEENGWIREGSLPFTIDSVNEGSMSTKEMYDALLKADLGPYIEFADDAFFYLGYEDAEDIANVLTERAGKDIDLVLTFGTSAGVFVKGLDLPVPMIDFSATDPVASGIIESTDADSGNPNVWAQVEPSLPLRQLKYYYSILPFHNLGVIIYGDETISGVPDIEASSKELGFNLIKYNIEEQQRETPEELDRYYGLVEDSILKILDEGIDAFFLTVDLINDPERLKSLLDHFYERGIPVYLMDDVEAVKNGALMLISANDLVNVGRFVADAVIRVFDGAEAGKLPCVYTSAPSIYLNYDSAIRIHYPLEFSLLAACEEIFAGGSSNNE